jgi:hypothetical protein
MKIGNIVLSNSKPRPMTLGNFKPNVKNEGAPDMVCFQSPYLRNLILLPGFYPTSTESPRYGGEDKIISKKPRMISKYES